MDTVHEGQVLAGKYRVERVLGKGGMGIVVAAMHLQLEQRVALKFLLPEGLEDADSRARFLREARAAVRLRSEHVARVLDVGTLDNTTPYIVMELLEGQDLDTLLEAEQKLPVGEAVEYVLQACEAIAEAHAAGIVHRDLKPANLFLTHRNDGSVCLKVLDFGISKVATNDSQPGGMTHSTTMLGTPHYMSPEQLRSSRDVDARSDIWSLGVILHELLTGQVAFRRDSLPELCAAILKDPVSPPRSLLPGLPAALEQVILQTLAKSPDDRPQDLAQLARALAPFTAAGDESVRRITSILELGSPRPVPSPRPASPTPPRDVPWGPSGVASPRPGGGSDETVSVPPRGPRTTPPAAPRDEPSAAVLPGPAASTSLPASTTVVAVTLPASAREPPTLPTRVAPLSVSPRSPRLVLGAAAALGLSALLVLAAALRTSPGPAAGLAPAGLAPASLAPASLAPASLAPADRASADRASADRASATLDPTAPTSTLDAPVSALSASAPSASAPSASARSASGPATSALAATMPAASGRSSPPQKASPGTAASPRSPARKVEMVTDFGGRR